MPHKGRILSWCCDGRQLSKLTPKNDKEIKFDAHIHYTVVLDKKHSNDESSLSV